MEKHIQMSILITIVDSHKKYTGLLFYKSFY